MIVFADINIAQKRYR